MNCPACGSTTYKRINGAGVKQYLHLDILPKTFQLGRCLNCQLVFKEQIPDDQLLQQYYQKISEDQWNHNEEYPHERLIGLYLNSIPRGSRVLDIGCGPGILLGKFSGYHTCFGIEANSRAGLIAESRGVKIIDSWISPTISNIDKFDCIILIDVFEHLANPFEIVKLAFSRLTNGGKLFIVTGAADSLPCVLLGPHYWYFKISQHIVFLNSAHLEWLEGELINSKISVRRIGHYQSSFSRFIRSTLKLVMWSTELKIRDILGLKLKQVPFEILRDFRDHYLIEISNIQKAD